MGRVQGRSQPKVAPGSVLMYMGVFAIEEQYITVIITEFSQIHWGQLTPITKPSFAPDGRDVIVQVDLGHKR